MSVLNLGEKELEYEVVHSKEASRIRIDVGFNGVKVVVPEKTSLNPEKFLEQKSGWVVEKQKFFKSYLDKIPERNFVEGEKISFLGKKREIKVSKSNSHKVTSDQIIVSKPYIGEKSLEEKVYQVLRRKAGEVIKEKVEKFSNHVKEEVNKVYIRDQKTKWGSCSSKNSLSFNWRICLGPEKVVDYIVVHELVHLENRSHDEKFWEKVEEILPDYEEHKNWLDERSHRLVFSKERFLDRIK